MLIAEGELDGLAILTLEPGVVTLAASGTGNLKIFNPPPGHIGHLGIWSDADPAVASAAAELRMRLWARMQPSADLSPLG